MLLDYAQKFAKMHAIGKLTTQCLDHLGPQIRAGITTFEIDEFVRNYAEAVHIQNAQYLYETHGSSPFPGHCCVSVNEVACHGIPSTYVQLAEGDLVSVDVTFIKDGYHGDACRTWGIGPVSKQDNDLLHTSECALQVGIQNVVPGKNYGSIGKSIQEYVEHNGFAVVEDFCGHGIGVKFHDFPQILHVDEPNSAAYYLTMKPGDSFTIEPIICDGPYKGLKRLKDGWTHRTKTKRKTAQFEATLGVTDSGVEVFCR